MKTLREDFQSVYSTTDFPIAQPIISIAANQKIPLIVNGSNGIGKTTMLFEISKHFPNSVFADQLDRGGLIKAERKGKLYGIENIFLGGIENTLDRKWEIATSTLAEISNFIDFTHGKNFIFQDEGNSDFTRHRINFIIAMTNAHLYRLRKTFKAIDFLKRFLILFVDRKIDASQMNQPFRLDYVPSKFDIQNLEQKTMLAKDPRVHLMLSGMYSGLYALKVTSRIPIYSVRFSEGGDSELVKHVYSPNLFKNKGNHSRATFFEDSQQASTQARILSDKEKVAIEAILPWRNRE